MSELRRARVAVGAGFFLQGLVFAGIVTQTPRFKIRFDIGDGGITAILVVVAVVSGLGSVLAGAIAARYTSAVAFRLALLWIGVGAVAVGVAPNLTAGMCAFAVYGLGVGGVDAGMNMQGVRVQEALGRSVMGSFHGLWSVAGIIGALYASLVARMELSLTFSLVIIAVVCWATVAAVSRHFIAAREHEVGLSARGIHLPWRPVLIFGAVILLFYSSDTGILAWCSIYLKDALNASASLAPLGYAAYQAGALISRFGGDILIRRIGSVRVAVAGTGLGTAGLLAVVAAPEPVTAIAAFFFVGLGLAIVVPLAFAGIAGAVGREAQDVAIARMNIANYAGAILGGGLIGGAASAGHLRWAFAIPLVLVPLIFFAARSFSSADHTTWS